MVSIIIPALREANKSALESIQAQTYTDYELVIVKGVSPNGKARNNGVATAKGEIFVFIDDDAVLGHESVLENLITPIIKGEADIVGASRRIPSDSPSFARLAARQLPLVETPIVTELTEANPELKRESWIKTILKNPLSIIRGVFDQSVWAPISTTCVAMKSSVYHQLNGFNEELWWGVDSEFFYRASKQGFRMALAPNTWVYHPYVTNFRGLWKKYFKSGIGSAHEMKLNPERNIQPPLNSLFSTIWFVVYRSFGAAALVLFKPLRAVASIFSAIGYVYGWYIPKDQISPTEAGHVRWERLPYWLLIGAVLFSPLSYHGTIELGFTLKISEVLLFLSLIAFLWTRLFRNSTEQVVDSTNISWVKGLRSDPLALIMVGYCLVAATSLTRAINVERGVLVLTQTILFMVGLVMLPREIIPSKRELFTLVKTYIFTSILVSFLGILQFFANYLGFTAGLRETYIKARAGYPRAHATFLEPLYMAHYLLTAISLVSAKVLFSNNLPQNVFRLLIMLIGLNLGFSRGGWIGLVVSICVLLVIWVAVATTRTAIVSLKRTNVLLSLLLVSFIAIPLSIAVGKELYTGVGQYVEESQRITLENKVKQDHTNDEDRQELERIIGNTEVTTTRIDSSPLNFLNDRLGRFFTLAVGSRIEAWELAIQFISKSPLIGVGIGNFGYQERSVTDGYEGLNFVNNQPLEVLAETGILGFTFYVLLNVYWIYLLSTTVISSWKSGSKDSAVLASGLLAGYAGVMTQFLTVSNWNIFHYWFILGLGFVLAKFNNSAPV